DRSPVRPPPGVPMFTFHIYAVLDKAFRFNREHDRLVLGFEQVHLPFELTHFVGVKGGYLVEARLCVEERDLLRGAVWSYCYGVHQRDKAIWGMAMRRVQIPLNPSIKELHVYEGFICRDNVPQSVWQKGLHMIGLKNTKGVEISNAWQSSASALLNRIFQKWTPSDKQSTESLCQSLKYFMQSLGSAHTRMAYPDNSHPPQVQVSELISENLLQILKGEPKEKLPSSCRDTSPL
ncbi:uncharacterized protein LOC102209754, partial [Pundamilia nyererei]|uniref:Uncharacterized protein LOC102209754 n=1 Tax=Pundamilia nyererei TaxID=303518 RepID=A0A9Y3S796_9CICH